MEFYYDFRSAEPRLILIVQFPLIKFYVCVVMCVSELIRLSMD